jgi:RNA polymerase sigma factor (sigma-70 family)
VSAHAIRAPLVRLRVGRLDDARLAELAAAGDERAFEVVYDRHHRPLLAFCRHMLGSQDEGEDALQQTFLRAHRSLLSQGAPDELRPWLFAIARNRCLTILAARKAAAVPVDEVEPSTDGLSAGVERRAELRDLLADIARLPDDQRSALVLAEIGDLSHAEIARVIEVPTAKVKALVHQARTRLIADRDARETPCEDVRALVATASGGELRRGPLRRHLAICDGCRAYKEAVGKQRASLALVLPVLPTAGLKDTIFGALGGGGGGAAAAGGATAGGAAAGSAGAGGVFSAGGATSGLAAKLAIGAALATGAGGGAVVVERAVDPPERAVTAGATTDGRTPTTESPAAALPGASDGSVFVDGPAAGRGSETGQAMREAAAERRRERAEQRRAAKQRRAEAREQAKRDRAADKVTRVAERDQRVQDRAAAKDQRTATREQRLASRPLGGSTNGSANANERSTTSAPKQKPAPTPRPAPVPKPESPSSSGGSGTTGSSGSQRALRVPTAVPAPTLAPATGESGEAKGKAVE